MKSNKPRAAFGFDGSMSNDFTVIKGETADGQLFTPTYGPGKLQTIWDPALWNGAIPRSEVDAAIHEIFEKFAVSRFYFDPPYWTSEIEAWTEKFGKELVWTFPTYRTARMHDALDRFTTDLATGTLTHDGCMITSIHVGNARRLAKPGDRYVIGKPNDRQKIDAAVASVIAHEAAADSKASWAKPATNFTYFA